MKQVIVKLNQLRSAKEITVRKMAFARKRLTAVIFFEVREGLSFKQLHFNGVKHALEQM